MTKNFGGLGTNPWAHPREATGSLVAADLTLELCCARLIEAWYFPPIDMKRMLSDSFLKHRVLNPNSVVLRIMQKREMELALRISSHSGAFFFLDLVDKG